MNVSAAQQLAAFCAALSWSAVDPVTRERAKELVLDHVAVVLAGQHEASTKAMQRFIARSAEKGPATIIGGAAMTSAPWAALANGTAAHAIEMDDGVRESSLHPGATVIPAAFATAEEVGANGTALLEAVVAGYEVAIRVGRALGPDSTYRRGFHPTGVAGVFGAAVAAGRVLKLDAERLARALGIAGTMASGSLEYLSDGSWTKRLNPGWAAHGGVVAAGLAAAGFTGPSTVFEGRLGFLRAYSDAPHPQRLLDDLGTPLLLTRVGLKTYACCRYVHGLIDCVLALRNRGIDVDDVEAMELGVISQAWLLVAEPIERKRDPQNLVDAQFSAPFATALAFVRGRAGTADFSEVNLRDRRIQRLMQRTSCFRDDAIDARFPAAVPSVVRVRLSDGRVLEERLDFPKGEPEHPLSRDELVDRSAELTGALLDDSQARGLARTVLALDSVDDLCPLMRTLHDAVAGHGAVRVSVV